MTCSKNRLGWPVQFAFKLLEWLHTLWSLIDGGVGIVGGLEKSQKLIAGGVGIIGGLEKIQCNDITDFARKS